MSMVGGGDGQDVELNIVPIIDCFTVLVTYLLISASFLSLASIDVGVAVTADASTPPPADTPKVPPYFLIVQLNDDLSYKVTLNGGPKSVQLDRTISPAADRPDQKALAKLLQNWKQENAGVEDVTFRAGENVVFKDMVASVEGIKGSIPKVFMSGDHEK